MKASDRVEYAFLKRVLLMMGFDERWVKIVVRCMSTFFYSFNFSG